MATRADRANRRLWQQKVDQYEKEVENARTDLERIKRRQKEARRAAKQLDTEGCSDRRKTKEPLCERDDKCKWVVGKGCLPADRKVEDPSPTQLEGMAQEQVNDAKQRLKETIQEGPEEKKTPCRVFRLRDRFGLPRRFRVRHKKQPQRLQRNTHLPST